MAKDPVVNAIMRGVYFKEDPVDLDSGKYTNRLQLLKVPRLTKERILRVSPDPTDYRTFGKIENGSSVSEIIDLGFMADAITLIVFNSSITISLNLDVWYRYFDDGVLDPENQLLEAFPTVTLTGVDNDIDKIYHFDIKPYDKFFLLFRADDPPDGFEYEIVFSKQKKTKISNDVYGASWNSEEKEGASKNALYDKVETLSPNTHNHNLNDLTEKNHTSLTNVLTDQHHAKYTNPEAISAVEAAGLNFGALTTPIITDNINQHSTFGRCQIGLGGSGYAYFGFRGLGATTFMIRQNSIFETIINTALGKILYFMVAGVYKMRMTGIGLYMSVPIIMAANKITGLGDPVAAQDAVTKIYSDLKLLLAGGTMSGEINMGHSKITTIGDPVAAQDAVTKIYSDLKLLLAGGTMSGEIAMGTNRITGCRDPLNDQDVATKKYVDDTTGSFPIGSIIMFSGAFTNNVTKVGWYICDGNNGTVNLINKFVRGGSASGAAGGSDDVVVVSHKHTIPYYTASGGGTPWIVTEGITGAIQYQDTSTVGVSGVGANKPAYYTLIFIQRIS